MSGNNRACMADGSFDPLGVQGEGRLTRKIVNPAFRPKPLKHSHITPPPSYPKS